MGGWLGLSGRRVHLAIPFADHVVVDPSTCEVAEYLGGRGTMRGGTYRKLVSRRAMSAPRKSTTQIAAYVW